MRLTKDRVHAALLAQPGATIDQLTEALGAPRRAVELHLRRLDAAGLAETAGSTEPNGKRGRPPVRWWGREKPRPIIASVWDLAA